MTICSKAWTTLLLSVISVSQAIAGDVSPWNSSIVISGGRSTMANACTSPWVIPDTTCTESLPVFRLAYIYHFSRTWGVEISGGQFAHAEASGSWATPPAPAVGPSNYDWQLQATGVTISGIGTIHLGDNLSVFGKAGILRGILKEKWNLSATNGEFAGITLNGVPITDKSLNHLTYGAGIQVDLNQNFALRAQYENFGTYDVYSDYGLPPVSEVTISLVTIGLVLNF